jgi:hypothetical protein
MRRLERTLIAAAVMATAALASSTGTALAADGVGTHVAVNKRPPHPATDETKPAAPATADPVGPESAPAASAADPDPDAFDRAGLESWWAKYRQAHPGH